MVRASTRLFESTWLAARLTALYQLKLRSPTIDSSLLLHRCG